MEKKFKSLTWTDIQAWAGSKIMSRGKNYQQYKYVEKLAQTSDGELIAWVRGTQRYATRVAVKGGKLTASCNCPYWTVCKHAVAVVLEYLAVVKTGKKIEKTEKTDSRLNLALKVLDDEDYYEDDYDEDEYDEDEYEENFSETPSKKSSEDASLKAFLKKKTKAELVDLVLELAECYSSVQEALQDSRKLADGSAKSVLEDIRKELSDLACGPQLSHDYWDTGRGGGLPDYSQVQERLNALISGNYYDEAISLGEDLLDYGAEAVEVYNDDGFICEQITDCLDIIFRALPHTSLDPVEQMVWVVDMELADSYDLCGTCGDFWQHPHEQTSWSSLADTLIDRLDKKEKNGEEILRSYKRDNLSNRAIDALEEAGRKDEIIPLCRQEAEITGCYVRLVDYLIEDKQLKEAEKWIGKGIRKIQDKWPGIASELRKRLEKIRKEEGNWSWIAATKAEEFFRRPSLNAWKEMEKSAKKIRVWKKVRPRALSFLESGNRPKPGAQWPLPKSELKAPEDRFRRSLPDTDTLIQIAIYEKKTG